jgi:molybdenum cofactor synthesis domain-containing protein
MAHAKLKGFRETTKVEVALKRLLDSVAVNKQNSELVQLDEMLGRALAEDIVSDVNVPSHDRAAMDGYAVEAADTFGASQTTPATLKIVGRVEMARYPEFQLECGEAAEISTGGIMPRGTDAVVMLEYAKRVDEKEIEVLASVTPNENVSRAGEDIRVGDIVLRQGTRLRAPDIAMLAALSISEARVICKPRVAVICTGSELVELGDSVPQGKIVNTNRFLLSALIRQSDAVPVYLGIAKDSLEDISRLIRLALQKADIVVVTGGTSVGERDLVPEAIDQVGKPGMIVHGISIRPGMPTGLASADAKPVISLSGQPVAAMIGFNMFVQPLVLRLLGTRNEPAASVKAKMSRRVASAIGMRTFLRVNVRESDGSYFADPIATAGSGVLSSMTKANGMVVISEDKEGIEAGEEVTVLLFRPVGRTNGD